MDTELFSRIPNEDEPNQNKTDDYCDNLVAPIEEDIKDEEPNEFGSNENDSEKEFITYETEQLKDPDLVWIINLIKTNGETKPLIENFDNLIQRLLYKQYEKLRLIDGILYRIKRHLYSSTIWRKPKSRHNSCRTFSFFNQPDKTISAITFVGSNRLRSSTKKYNLEPNDYVGFLAFENRFVHFDVSNDLRKIQPIEFSGRGMMVKLNCHGTESYQQAINRKKFNRKVNLLGKTKRYLNTDSNEKHSEKTEPYAGKTSNTSNVSTNPFLTGVSNIELTETSKRTAGQSQKGSEPKKVRREST
ncbi:unnamed protein product [Brachionus calyciflorus]|uniref:Uncharacterized protein n=1 Tax=Brachionus calyciflorus TaxID=104777 RepID=A0A814H1W9_9BILA|nr:unnamed protein product [Brachionus calyciflorus]